MVSNPIKVKDYVEQFAVVGITDLNCTYIAKLLYTALLYRFKTDFTPEEYELFAQYQTRVFDLVENLRERPVKTIDLVLDYVGKIDPYLADIIIMMWSLPRATDYFSKTFYHTQYKKLIRTYNSKLAQLIDHNVIKNFCLETLSKTGSVPVHCIDIVWYYMNMMSIDFIFFDAPCADYLSVRIVPYTEFIEFSFNMEQILELGLGEIEFATDPTAKGPFKIFIKTLITNPIMVSTILQGSDTNAKIFFKQLMSIKTNLKKYFGEDHDLVIPQQPIDQYLIAHP